LTVLDSRQYRPVGSVSPVDADVRVVAATNKVLYQEVRAKRFRDDLYYRLLVVAINLPPLRERGDDVLELTEHFLRRYSGQYGRVIRGLEPAAKEVFRQYRWPGNVRQLQNVIERIVLLENDEWIRVKHIPPRLLLELNGGATASDPLFGSDDAAALPLTPRGRTVDFHGEVARFQRAMLLKAFADAEGNVSDAARRVNLSRHAFRHHWARLSSPTKRLRS